MDPDKLSIEEIRQSGFFDENWYLRNYEDVAELAMSPIEHFTWIGHRLMRNPGPNFSVEHYLTDHPDVRAAGVNALLHYVRTGKAEGRTIKRADGTSFLQAQKSPSPAKTKHHQPLPDTRSSITQAASILLVSGEPLDRPGAIYRIMRFAESFRASGCKVEVMDREKAAKKLDRLENFNMLYVWRARWPDIKAVCMQARALKIPYVFDVDDLMVRPELATAEFIDAIRFNKHNEENVKAHYSDVRDAMLHADYCVASTRELAWHMRASPGRRPTFVIPNTYDRAAYQKSRVAARRKQATPDDGKIRIGYASGSRTHQADFKLCSRAVADILRAHPETCLVLFRRNDMVTLDVSEFPEFVGLENRIEWREFVPLIDLPNEVARFDINLAPLEVGNPFCESKSELKYFEAAIADVPTIASPTGPYRWAIDHGRTGFLANDQKQWSSALEELVRNADRRREVARQAHRAALWDFGPVRRAELVASLLDHVHSPRRAGRAMHFEQHIQSFRPRPIHLQPHRILATYDKGEMSRVTVVIPLYNYENFITEALDSVKTQIMRELDLIIVDDKSTDSSASIAQAWLAENHARFNRALLVQHNENSGLGNSRNTGFDLSDTLYIMALDADNRLLPDCCERLMSAIERTKSAFSYSVIQQFGDATSRMGTRPFDPADFIPGNVIDAMAMISKEVWSLVGGYADHRMGWQDYDFWCRVIDAGLSGQHVDRILSEYRVHGNSMLRTATDRAKNKAVLIDQMEKDFAWISPLDMRVGYRVPAPTPQNK